MRRSLALVALLLAIAPAAAMEAAAASGVPPGVLRIIDGYPSQCRAAGGQPGNGAARIIAGDVDGDTRLDYVVDPVALTCTGAATAYCGNGGCTITVLLSSTNYAKPLKFFGGEPSLTQRAPGTVLALAVDATNCNVPKWQATCAATYSFRRGVGRATYIATPRPKP